MTKSLNTFTDVTKIKTKLRNLNTFYQINKCLSNNSTGIENSFHTLSLFGRMPIKPFLYNFLFRPLNERRNFVFECALIFFFSTQNQRRQLIRFLWFLIVFKLYIIHRGEAELRTLVIQIRNNGLGKKFEGVKITKLIKTNNASFEPKLHRQ